VSKVSKIYDPLGLVSPVVFHSRWFLQKLCSIKIEWDDCLPPGLCEEWERLILIFQESGKNHRVEVMVIFVQLEFTYQM